MNQTNAIQQLAYWDSQGRIVFTLHDLAKIFSEDRYRTLKEGVNRLVRNGFLVRVCNGVFVNPFARNCDGFILERIAKAIRRGEYCYVSFESALSEYGLISQIPIDRLTVMTTGRKGEYKTPYGVIEFTHTKRSLKDILSSMSDIGRPLRFATPEAALRDLKRSGRNVQLVLDEEIDSE